MRTGFLEKERAHAFAESGGSRRPITGRLLCRARGRLILFFCRWPQGVFFACGEAAACLRERFRQDGVFLVRGGRNRLPADILPALWGAAAEGG